MEEGQDEHTNSYSVPVQLRIPFGMNETLTCAWASHSHTASTAEQID